LAFGLSFQVAVTSQPKTNSQVRLCRGSTAGGGQTVQIAGAGKLELDVRCRWRSVWQLLWVLGGLDAQGIVGTGDAGDMDAEMGTG
jgi:hypothetical protein